jgi:uncharacterized protein
VVQVVLDDVEDRRDREPFEAHERDGEDEADGQGPARRRPDTVGGGRPGCHRDIVPCLGICASNSFLKFMRQIDPRFAPEVSRANDWVKNRPDGPSGERRAPHGEREEGWAMAQSAGLHEPQDQLDPATIDRHRALVSLQEELEAVDWYAQRVDAATDPELAAVLAHNRDEEKEHAAMVLEWLRRNDPVLDRHLRTYLFTEGSILEIEVAAEHGGADGPEPGAPGTTGTAGSGSLGIGSLRGERR